MRALLVAAVVEPVSLLVLLVNLATVHVPWVAALLGPVHGTAYLVAIAATWTAGFPRRARVLAWVPAVGALLAVRFRDDGSQEPPTTGRRRAPVTRERGSRPARE